MKKGSRHCEEAKKKIRMASIGRKHLEETKQKMSFSRKGKKLSLKTKKKISLTLLGRKRPEISGDKHPMYGKHHSEESKKKMSLTLLKNPQRYWLGRKRPEMKKIMGWIAYNRAPWNKGLTKETDIRLLEYGKKVSITNKGRHHNEETKKKMSLAQKGHKASRKVFTKESRKKFVVPKKDTTIEIKIQNFLKQLNIDFFTHQYIKEIEHGYQCDIFIPSKNLVIECDGNYWHHFPTGTEMDNIRTKELLDKGFKVLRLWEIEIRKMELNDFKEKIDAI